MTNLSLLSLLLAMLSSQSVFGQLFPGLEGEQLADAIRTEYKPTQLLTFSQAKDTLYARVFIQNDSVKCIYSGLSHYLPAGVDPSQWVFGSGNEVESINLEHGWPQAKGAGDGTDGQMNMYNLFPARVAINSDRGDFPYSDINDDATSKWYYLGQVMTTKPTVNINAYSEFKTGNFEPRESVKGDIARAMFYFWTIYRDDAIIADPDFFEQQRTSLCQWQEEDPVDDFENLRNDRISTYQSGKKNPFVLDCTLAKRAYCPLQTDCNSVSVIETNKASTVLRYDPSESRLLVDSDASQHWNINVISISGQNIYAFKIESNQWSDSLPLRSGIYIAYCFGEGGISILKIITP
ncbi:MAG: endonuclease [Saprospiraceae bacterium]|uniref:Endonuclease n=1 Tax=Candidatus Opimibacter skivensis TaxID=2982028 RepID=A0A9D7SSP3_9BACT|nr:endonuclease [Candidatus Opimibacter skivensis]